MILSLSKNSLELTIKFLRKEESVEFQTFYWIEHSSQLAICQSSRSLGSYFLNYCGMNARIVKELLYMQRGQGYRIGWPYSSLQQ